MLPRVAVIGMGYWGSKLARVFDELGVLSALVDTDPERLAALRAEHPTRPVFNSIDELLAGLPIDAVAIATPPERHPDLCRTALQAGWHVLVEKPMALSVSQGREVVELAENRKLCFMVGHLLLYHPAMTELLKLTREKRLGLPLHLYSERLCTQPLRGGNALWMLGPHDVSLALSCFGQMPIEVQCQNAPFGRDPKRETVFLRLRFPHATASIRLSTQAEQKVRRVLLACSERLALFDDLDEQARLRLSMPLSPHPPTLNLTWTRVSYEAAEPLKVQARHFLECLQNGESPRTHGRHGLEVLSVLEAAERSLTRNGAPEPLSR